jgi:hypothetical protein
MNEKKRGTVKTFEIECDLGDGLANAPALVVEAKDADDLVSHMVSLDTFTNDYGDMIPVGATVTVKRLS